MRVDTCTQPEYPNKGGAYFGWARRYTQILSHLSHQSLVSNPYREAGYQDPLPGSHTSPVLPPLWYATSHEDEQCGKAQWMPNWYNYHSYFLQNLSSSEGMKSFPRFRIPPVPPIHQVSNQDDKQVADRKKEQFQSERKIRVSLWRSKSLKCVANTLRPDRAGVSSTALIDSHFQPFSATFKLT